MLRLPLECLLMILEELDIKDLLNCRLVSLAFKYATSKSRIKELICVNNSKKFTRLITELNLKWYSTDQILSSNNLINLDTRNYCLNNHHNCQLLSCHFDLLKNLFDLKFLKRLKINYLIIDDRFEKEYLAKFQFIDHLEINQQLNNVEFKRILKLNNLKVLCINRDNDNYIPSNYYKDYKCIFDAPKLEILHHQNRNFYLINLLRPETIKKLYYPTFINALFKFNNLEYLIVNCFDNRLNNESIDNSIIYKLPNLKILDVIFRSPFEMNADQSHNSLCNLINQRNKLKSDLKIYVNHLLILNIEEFHDLIDNYLDYFQINDSF